MRSGKLSRQAPGQSASPGSYCMASSSGYFSKCCRATAPSVEVSSHTTPSVFPKDLFFLNVFEKSPCVFPRESFSFLNAFEKPPCVFPHGVVFFNVFEKISLCFPQGVFSKNVFEKSHPFFSKVVLKKNKRRT